MRSTVVAGLVALLVCTSVAASPVVAQSARPDLRVSVPEENFRAAPGGTRVAVLLAGAPLRGGEASERWREVTVDGWVHGGSVAPSTRDGHDLAISTDGATLHLEPGGTVIARGLEGFLLHEVSRRDGWVRVRRTGWIWAPSLERVPAAASAPANDGTARAAAEDEGNPAPAEGATPEVGPHSLHASPNGAGVGTIAPDLRLEVVGREGEWARVRVEGWVRMPAQPDATTAPLADLSLRALRDSPELYRGRSVSWRVQFVALQRADSLRTDFRPDESYLLTRDPDGEPGYVYIAVPEAMLPRVRRLIPLQQVEVVGRVRSGSSPLMGHPVLDLVELRPIRQ